MDINRNQYFMAGLVLLLLGIQFHLVDSYVLTPQCTQFLAKRTGNPVAAVNTPTQPLPQAAEPTLKKTVHPPEWLGWCLMSIGSVLILHSWAMPKPS